MNDSNDQENSQYGGWLGRRQIAGLSTVISSIYDQALHAFNRSSDVTERDVVKATETGVGLEDVFERVQHAGWNVIQRTQILGSPSRAEIEQEVQNTLLRLGIPSRERVEKISRELDGLNALLDQRLAERRVAQKAAKSEE